MTRSLRDSEADSPTMRKRWAASRALLWVRVVATIMAWILIIVYSHRLAHAYQSDIARALESPFAQLGAAVLLLTALVYFVILSLPFVPNLGPRGVGVVFVWVALLVLGHSLSHQGFHDAQAMLSSMRDAVGFLGLVALATAYAVALAVPFVPGVELGLLIMALFGAAGAVTAHAATVGGLSLAFVVGRLLPNRIIAGLLNRLGIPVPSDELASAMRGMVAESRLGRSMPRRLSVLLVQYRYPTLAVCLNFPGNSALGGGGGLALLCGLSRQFTWRSFLLTVVLATAPVPALVLGGLLNVDPLLEHHGFVHNMLTRIEGLFIHD
jgi:uncharacterized membrane protein YdjX (TVP38/TMEM64 family)